jgi:hypothetical protein
LENREGSRVFITARKGPQMINTVLTIEKRQRGRARAAPSPNAFAYTISDAQSLGAPGRTKIYSLAKAGRLTLRKIDGRTLIDGDSLRALLKSNG